MPTVSIMDPSVAKQFHRFTIGDQVVFRVTASVESLSHDSVSLVIDDLKIDNDAKTVHEAARRAVNEIQQVQTRVEPAIG